MSDDGISAMIGCPQACNTCDACGKGNKTVVELAVATPSLSTLVAAVQAADLVDTLSGDGPFTVFAPTNDAFNALPAGVVADLLKPENKGSLIDILTYHVLGAAVCSSSLTDGQKAQTLEGNDVTVSITSDGVFINNALVTVVDVQASNGVVHIIDAVLLPPTPSPSVAAGPTIVDLAVATPSLSTLVAALDAAGLVGALEADGPFTVFAPTNDAFDALPQGVVATLLKPENKQQLIDILTYHVVSGEVRASDIKDGAKVTTIEGRDVTTSLTTAGVFINNAKVITADVGASNGVVHIIDAVLLPPAPSTPSPSVAQGPSIVDLAVATPSLSILVTALKSAGLVDVLGGPGPFTVFAPTNDAFEALPAGVVENLLKPDNKDQLVAILTYHVVSGEVQSKDIVNGAEVQTLEGSDVKTTITSSGVFINKSKVITADVGASNGVVHIIDAVLLPPSKPAPTPFPTNHAGCPVVSTVENLDLKEYISKTWFVQKQQVNSYQPRDSLYCVSATYDIDGAWVPFFFGTVVSVRNYGNVGGVNGKNQNGGQVLCARLPNKKKAAELLVAPCFLPNFLAGDYWVVAIGDNYEWAIVSGGQPTEIFEDGCTTKEDGINGSGFWYFTREQVASEETLAEMDAAARGLGYTTSQLIKVEQEGCKYEGAKLK